MERTLSDEEKIRKAIEISQRRNRNYEYQRTAKVNVTNNLAQKHVVWLGGSTFASSPSFGQMVHSRAEYLEKGPSCCRFNAVFGV